MGLEFHRSPEGRLIQNEGRDNRDFNSPDKLAIKYEKQAQALLASEKGMIVRNELAPFAQDVVKSDRDGKATERDALLETLVGRLKGLTKTKVFETIEDEHERAAFTLALAHEIHKSTH